MIKDILLEKGTIEKKFMNNISSFLEFIIIILESIHLFYTNHPYY